jgi:hypothetical protein
MQISGCEQQDFLKDIFYVSFLAKVEIQQWIKDVISTKNVLM